MPQSRKHESNAIKQAAYRQRRGAAYQEQLRSKGLPPLPVLPEIPGRARWQSAITSAGALIEQTATEMQGYYADRSEEWQETTRAETLLEQIEVLEGLLDELRDLTEPPNRRPVNHDERRTA